MASSVHGLAAYTHKQVSIFAMDLLLVVENAHVHTTR